MATLVVFGANRHPEEGVIFDGNLISGKSMSVPYVALVARGIEAARHNLR